MAVKLTNAEKINEAIVNKVSDVLHNANLIQSIDINIKGSVGELPEITYKITELIAPCESEAEKES